MSSTFAKARRVLGRLARARRLLRRPRKKLADIDREIAGQPELPLSTWFARWSPEEYAELYVSDLSAYPALASRLPAMPPPETQRHWNGNDGRSLMCGESATFLRLVKADYERLTGRALADARVLDYGAGWGRLTRMFLQHVPDDRLDAVDAWERSVDLFNDLGFRTVCRLVEPKPTLPVPGPYDLIILFSVLTHLPDDVAESVLDSVRPALSHGGLLAATLRPGGIWVRQGEPERAAEHERTGYSHRPQGAAWGDTSMTVEYLTKRFPGWRVVDVEPGMDAWNQTLLFLAPSAS